MAIWTYMLRCAHGSCHAGHTDSPDRRISAHMAGRAGDYTARRQPVTLVWNKTFPSRIEALAAERRIKGPSRAKKEALIAGDWARLSHFARPPRERPSTSLGSNGGEEAAVPFLVRPGPVEGRAASGRRLRQHRPPGTHGSAAPPNPFVSSEVETHRRTP